MPATPRDKAVVETYGSLMGEVRARLEAVNKCAAGAYGLPGPLVHELCFLQFRMICELIALACLTAHGDLANAGLRKQWSAETIVNALDALHPSFYPEPIKQVPATPPINAHFEPLGRDYLTKSELIALVAKCGAMLHRGSLKKIIFPKKTPIQNSFPEIMKITGKITNLVSLHRVTLLRPGKLYVCMFRQDRDRNVEVYAVEAIEKA